MTSDIIFVQFKELTSKIEQSDEMAFFESTKTLLGLTSPVSGMIEKVNEKLSESSELASKDAYGEDWFATIRLENFENDCQNLLSAQDYFEVLKKKVETERKKLGRQ